MSSDMLNQLDEWLANGDIDEETYNKLKEKYGSKGEEEPKAEDTEPRKVKVKKQVTVRMTPPPPPKEVYSISTGAIVIGLFFILFGVFWVLSILSYEPFKTIFDNVKSSFGEPLTACFCLFGMIVLFLIGLLLVVNSMRRRFKPVETGLGTLLIVLAVMLFLHQYQVLVFDWWLLFACCVVLLGMVLIAGAFKKRKKPSSWREWMNWTEWMEWD